MEFRLVRRGGRLGRVIVAHQHKHAAIAGCAGKVGVAKHVAGAIDAWPLAVPDGENTVELALAAHLRLLAAPDGGGGEVFVDAGLEDDMGGVELLAGAFELLVKAADARAAVAGDEPCRIEASPPVALLLHQQQAGDGLGAGNEDAFLGEIVFVVQGNVLKRDGSG